MSVDRRRFVSQLSLMAGAGALIPVSLDAQAGSGEAGAPPDWLPLQDPVIVKEMVGVAHRDLNRVRELLERQPALANATIDWGFGDWESALGAASHVGRREIAELLLASGAHPSLFSAAMLGQLDVVKAFVAARPGIQRTHGPHGIPLLAHARAGGKDAAAVVSYLETLGDADRRTPTQPLDNADRDALAGEYVFGPAGRDRFVVDVQNDRLGIERPGANRQLIHHVGGLVFFPSGVPSVKIAFARASGPASQLTVANPDVFLTAKRRA